ncbi:MAG TPA: isocitrate lyase/phosphoenolpyruvate mutase family protein, partial [Lysobacter sp.]
MSTHADRATSFRQLHAQGVLRLANAWDAGTARLIESLGAPAIATTSAGVAWSRGYADGDTLPIEHLLTAVEEIARVIRVPLSVDVEGGYSDDPAVVADNVMRLAELGVVGINLEDGGGTPEALCGKIARIRQACATRGLDVYVNARTDV